MSAQKRTNVQTAPYPDELDTLVADCRYRAHEGWSVTLEDVPDRDLDPVTQEPIGHGLTLKILTKGYDTYNPERGPGYRVYHYFIVPAATYNRAAWMRWLFECFAKVELHEAMENFTLRSDAYEPEDVCECGCEASDHDGRVSECLKCGQTTHRFAPKTPRYERPFAPLHGPGEDPYVVHEYATGEQRRTRFTGELAPS